MDKAKEILTKYWVGILCGVIALIAIIANFVPLGSYHEELKGKLQSSADTYSQIDNLMRQTRLKPKLLDDPEQKELNMFPSPTVIESGQRLVAKLEDESKAAMAEVVKVNRHEQLVNGVLPEPRGNFPFNFRAEYIKRLAGDDGTGGTLAKDVLKAVMPPTNEQIAAEEKRKWTEEYVPRLIFDNAGQGGRALNQDQVEADFQVLRTRLPNDMREAAAKSGLIYMAPNVLAMEPSVANKIGPPPTTPTIWWAQMALWVQEDVVNAIAHANRDATDVTNARVKRLVAVNVPIGPSMIYGKPLTVPGSGMGGMGGAEAPAPVPYNPNEPVTLDYKVTPTGRTSNPLYDVVHYQVEMVVGAKDLPAVLASFSDKRLVTVVNIDSLVAEDSTQAAKEGFIYGPDPVLRVVLRCESLFLREWTIPLMPEVIKKLMGIAPPTQTM